MCKIASRSNIGIIKVKVTNIHQIEITSRCNLKCRYCAHPKMPRAKQDMDRKTFERALYAATTLRGRTFQREINLAGIGESTMHPEFVDFVALAREKMGSATDIILATNGLLMTDELAAAIAPYRPKVWVSLHRPEKAGLAVEALRRAGILSGVSADPSIASINWAGQVDWPVSAPDMACQWVPLGRAMVMSDGRVTTCCLDGNAEGVIGNVWDVELDWQTRPYRLCEGCNYSLPEWAK